MAKYEYLRVSSLAQDYDQQQQCINEYFARVGIDPSTIDSIVVEKISGTVNHTERKLAQLIGRCKEDDMIIVSELSRLGRNMSDLFAIVTECCERGIYLIQAKDGSQIENKSIGGKALLFALGLAAEIEVQNIRQRTNMGLAVRKQWLKEKGEFISKSGRICKKLGREKGCDLTAANIASAKSRQDAAIAWREQSKGYQLVRKLLRNGESRNNILSQFNMMHEIDPENYSTPNGTALTKGTLSKWCREIENITMRI